MQKSGEATTADVDYPIIVFMKSFVTEEFLIIFACKLTVCRFSIKMGIY